MAELNGDLRVKVNSQELEIFIQKSERQLRKPYPHFIREIISAYNDGRLRIVPTEDQKRELGELYEH